MASRMTSPSALTTKRSTPWVLGCCGPMLRVISSVSRPAPPLRCTSTSNPDRLIFGFSSPSPAQGEGRGEGCFSSPQQAFPPCADAVVFLGLDEILAQRITDPVLRHQQAAQVGM